MKATQNLSQTQTQQLRLTPQQVRFGRLLEMSQPEFEDEVQRALEENPALEPGDPAGQSEPGIDSPGSGDNGDFAESAEQLQRADYASDDDIPSYRLNINNRSADDPIYEREAADPGTQGIMSLESQLADLDLSSRERELARYVIGNLDGNGYLTRTPEAMADDYTMATGYAVSPRGVHRAVDVVRSLDPAGIGATDLRDCLLLQLERLPRHDATVALAESVLERYFEPFARHNFDRIRTALKLSEQSFAQVLALIRSLNPKPGSALSASAEETVHLVPDYEVAVDLAGNITAAPAAGTPLPVIAESFAAAAKAEGPQGTRNAATAYLRERHEAAREFIDLAQRRQATMQAVIDAIVRLQPEFFATGDRARLRPMVLRDIQTLTGLDLSVISRATGGKYAMTPAGMVALKSLFSSTVSDANDKSVAYIEAAIASMVAAESKRRPLSDDAIRERLLREGVDVARRTVAKYRERLGIPVARLRKT